MLFVYMCIYLLCVCSCICMCMFVCVCVICMCVYVCVCVWGGNIGMINSFVSSLQGCLYILLCNHILNVLRSNFICICLNIPSVLNQ